MHGSKTERSRQGQGGERPGSVARRSRVFSSYLPKEKENLRQPTTDQNSVDQRNAKPRCEGAGEQGEAKDKERARRPKKKKYANVAKRKKGEPRGIAIIPLVSRRRGLFATDATGRGVSTASNTRG